jgi:hypothetical protein
MRTRITEEPRTPLNPDFRPAPGAARSFHTDDLSDSAPPLRGSDRTEWLVRSPIATWSGAANGKKVATLCESTCVDLDRRSRKARECGPVIRSAGAG